MRLTPHYYPSYLPPLCTEEENLAFLKKGIEELGKILAADDSTLAVNVWNANGIAIAIAPQNDVPLEKMLFHYSNQACLVIREVGPAVEYLKLEHQQTRQGYIIYSKPRRPIE